MFAVAVRGASVSPPAGTRWVKLKELPGEAYGSAASHLGAALGGAAWSAARLAELRRRSAALTGEKRWH